MRTPLPDLIGYRTHSFEQLKRSFGYEILKKVLKGDPTIRNSSDLVLGRHGLRDYIVTQIQDNRKKAVQSILLGKSRMTKTEHMAHIIRELDDNGITDESVRISVIEMQQKYAEDCCREDSILPDTINIVQDILIDVMNAFADDAFEAFKNNDTHYYDFEDPTFQQLIAWRYE